MSTSSELECEVLSSIEEVEALSERWEQLLQRSPCSRAFSSFVWCWSALRSSGRQPYVVTAWSGGELRAILPLARNEENEAAPVSAFADYNDIIAGENDTEAAIAVLRHALAHSRVNIHRVCKDSHCAKAAEALGVAGMYRIEARSRSINFADGYGRYLTSRSAHLRKRISQARRAAKQAGVEVLELDPREYAPQRAVEQFLELHLERIGTASHFQPNSAPAKFVLCAFPELFRQGRLRIFAVRQGATIVATDVTAVGPAGLALWNRGYTASAAKWSPGLLLLDAQLRISEAEGVGSYDLLRGDQEWKGRWANQELELGRLRA
jgi:CelD/BcsL family acetyltransferase involved in cellulose biosynthesis